MAGSIVQSVYAVDDSGGTSTTISVTITGVAAGALLAAHVGWGTSTITVGVSDGSAFSVGAASVADVSDDQLGSVLYRANVASGSHTVVATFSAGAPFRRLRVCEVAGIATTSPLDVAGVGQWQSSAGTAANAVSSTASSATGNANDFVMGFSQDSSEGDPGSGTVSAGTGYTISGSNIILALEGKNVAATGAQTATFTQSANNARITHVVAFIQAAGGGTVYNESVSEAGTAAATVANLLTALNTVTESGSATDALATLETFVNALTEALTGAMTVSGALTNSQSITESGTAADSAAGGLLVVNALTEAGTAADALSNFVAWLNAFTEAGTAADAITSQLVATNAISEAGTAGDSVSAGNTTYDVSVTEPGSLADVVAGLMNVIASLSEAASAADSAAAGEVFSNSVAEAGTAGDSTSQQYAANASVSDSGNAGDALSTLVTFLGSINEALSAADALDVTGGTPGSPSGAGKHHRRKVRGEYDPDTRLALIRRH